MFGIIGAFCSLVSTAVSVVTSVATTIGTVVAKAASTIISTIPKLLNIENVLKAVKLAADIISGISKVLGLSPEDENPEELGAKTMQEDTRPKRPDETTEEYLGYLRSVPLDKEKYTKMSEAEKVAANAIGTGMLMKNIDEKYHVAVTPEFIAAVHKTEINYEQAAKLIKSFEKNNIESTKDFADYMGNDLSADKVAGVSSSVREALKEMNPEATDAEINKEVISMKQAYNKDA